MKNCLRFFTRSSYLSILCFVTIFSLMFCQTSAASLADNYEVRIPDHNLRSILQSKCNLTVGELAKIETINSRDLPIKDLTGIEYATGLKQLTLTNSSIKNIEPLSKLSNLRSLNLKNNNISDITALSSLAQLQEIDLESNSIQNIDSLKNLYNLIELNLSSNDIKDITPLSNLINLKKLDISDNELDNIDALEVLHNNGGLRLKNVVDLSENWLDLGTGSSSYRTISMLRNDMVIISLEPQKRIQLVIDKIPLSMDVPPQIINGRTMVPLRVIFEELGASVSWDSSTKEVFAVKENTTIVLKANNKVVRVNGQVKIIDVAPTVIDGRTLVPARFVAETLGKKVSWDEKVRTVRIDNPIN